MSESFFILPDGQAWSNPLFVSRDGKVESVTPDQTQAAPDLLAACEAVWSEDSEVLPGLLTSKTHKMLEDAIAKAKGETA